MAKSLNTVNLTFNADTAKAKSQIQDLQNSLNQLIKAGAQKSAGQLGITKEITEAQVAASKLSTILSQSMNTKTGNLDLTKFTQSLDKSGMSLKSLKGQLDSLGPSGQKAFLSLAQSISQADVPLRRTNAMVTELWTSIKNTARWQLSSSMLHGVMGAYQQAMGYAKDLDKSLNNIQIVTGKNSEEMARFAEQANKAAKALSTTTTKYTDASLIYFQQGLDGDEVTKRADITVKMANVTGQSAETVSDQMTAVWNNFYDGSKSLEHYADVMTALGAATASSSEEIAGGLEKFAAIGDTIGLSFEYAASALATITSNTRQSEEVVGTALKTIFARIQGLELGETLEDGTDLNKYSQALASVGVSIKDSAGELKNMDTILDEMAAKWGTLNKDQQVALAQTVAGVRQYTQLVALMDNWNNGDGDSMMANLSTSNTADGALQEQADTYAESWQAARDRVKAATEDMFDSLINPDFFKSFLDGFETIISGVARFVDALNGLPGILTLVASLMTRVFGDQIAKSIDNLKFGLDSFAGKTQDRMEEVRQEASQLAQTINFNTGTEAGNVEGEILKQRLELQDEIRKVSQLLTKEEQEQLSGLMAINDAYAEQALLAAKAKDAAQQDYQEKNKDVRKKIVRHAGEDGTLSVEEYNKVQDEMQEIAEKGVLTSKALKAINTNLSDGNKEFKGYGAAINRVAKHLEEVGRPEAAQQVRDLHKQFKEGKITSSDFQKSLKGLITEDDILQDTALEASDALYEQAKASNVTQQECDDLAESLVKTVQKNKESESINRASAKSVAELKTHIQGFKSGMDSFGQTVTKTMQGFSSLAMGIQGFKAAFDTLKDPDLSGGEKILQMTMSLTMAIPALIAGLSALAKVKAENVKQDLLSIGSSLKDILIKGKDVVATTAQTVVTKTQTAAESGSVVAKMAHAAANVMVTATSGPLILAVLALVAGLVVLVAIVWAVVSAFQAWQNSTPEAKLKAAEEEASRLGEELSKAKEEAAELKSTIEGYDSAVDKIKELEKGTKEWRAAIEDANDKARELIDKGGLEGQYHFNAETGLIEFDEGALEAAQSKADQKAKAVQAQKLMADNDVLSAQTAVKNKEVATENSSSVYKGAALTGLASLLLPGIGTAIVGGLSLLTAGLQKATDNGQTKALERLQEAYEKSGGNIVTAMNSLSVADTALINSMGMTKEELAKLCQETSANTAAILENNKQIIGSTFEGNKDYEGSANKEFLNEVLAGDLADETDKLYEEKYKDKAGNLTDAEAQKQYAELMGWDANLVDNKSGNKAVYIDNEGNEVTLSDEQVRKYLAQQEALQNVEKSIKDTSGEISKLALQEKLLAKAADGSIESYEEYRKAMHKYGEELGFTAAEIDSYIAKQGNMQEAAKKTTLANNIQSWGHSEKGSKAAAESLAAGLTDQAGVSVEEQMDIMVKVSATAESYDEFRRNFEQALNDAFLTSFQNSSANVESILANAEETGAFSTSDIKSLEEDENFQAYLEETGKTMLEFTSANYSEKYAIISQFYADLKAAEYDALATSKENYQADLAEYQAILDYKRSLNEDGSETEQSKAIKEQWDNIDFSAYLDVDTSEIESKMDEVQNAIDEIDGQQIKLDLEWESTDAIENGIKKIGNFAKMMEKDTKKVGDSYQFTAAQAREWMQVYPELFQNAEVTTDGLLSLNGDYVEEFIEGQEASTDAAIDANIVQLESRISELEAEKAAYEADLELAESNAVGKEQLESASAEYLAETRDALTQYYMDLGLDEVAAQKAALDTMGLNEIEYSELVANAHSRNAENQIESAEQGATGMLGALSKLWNKIKEWGQTVGNLFKNVWGALTGKVEWSEVWGAFSGGDIDSGTTVTGISAYDENGNFQEGSEAERTAVLKEINAQSAENLRVAIADIDGRIASIRSEIAYNEALKNQDLSDYGSTDPDEVDGTKDKDKGGNDKKDVEDLIEVAERYHEITKEVETLEHQLDILGKQKDRLFGKNKLAKMDEEIAKYKELAEKQSDLADAQKVFLALDQVAVEEIGATFDENGNISNYSDLVADITADLNAAKQTYNDSAQEDGDKELLDAAQKEYDEKIKLLEQYEETLDAVRESEKAALEAHYAWQDANFEKLSYALEIKIEVDETQLKMIDYYLKKMDGDVYSMGEAMELMMKNTEKTVDGVKKVQKSQATILLEQASDYQNQYLELQEKFANGEISEAAYMEGIKAVQEGLIGTAEALGELDDQMMNYYSNTLVAAQQEIDKYTSRMDQVNEVLEHYGTILDLSSLSKTSEDYFSKMDTVLEGQAHTAKNSMEAAKAAMTMFQDEMKSKKLAYEDALKQGDEKLIEFHKKQYEDALDAANQAELEYLSKVEDYANKVNEILDHTLNKLAVQLEDALTGGTSFDRMNSGMERMVSLHEEYLTTTNKIYETSKLMRSAQQEIDKTSNTVAKNKMKQFIQETQNLQNQTKLSKFELDIQQAKYDLLVAEIALEEAQNAKSAVRLQRDNEGNFGYVYTADQEVVSNAEQEFLDAQNALYNIGLEGANEYVQKYQQTMSEMYDTLTSLAQQYRAGEFASEAEYQAAVDEAKQYYYEKLDQYSYLHSQAIQADSRVATDYILSESNLARTSITGDTITVGDTWRNTFLEMSGWATDEFGNISGVASDWRNEVTAYVNDVNDAFDEWGSTMSTNVTPAIGDLDTQVGNLKTTSDNLLTTLTGEDGVISKLEEEIQKVSDLSLEYIGLRDAILDAIAAAEETAQTIVDEYSEAAGDGDGDGDGDGSGGGGDGSGGGDFNKDKIEGVAAAIWMDGQKSGWGNDPERKKKLKEKGVSGAQDYINKSAYNGTIYKNWHNKRDQLKKYYYGSFDTGGYTGDWSGPDGKFAMLHQKELVLNKGDTENFLASMGVLEKILQVIDIQSANQLLSRDMSVPYFGNMSQGTLEQQVHIEASFPNATDKNEIEEAFRDIVNLASQYANRK